MTFNKKISAATSRSFNLGKWLWKNKFIVLLIVAYIPLIISTINIAKTNDYPVGQYLLVQSGTSVINADYQIYEKTILLERDPNLVIGMDKLEYGIWNNVKYYWKLIIFVISIMSLIGLITFPFFMAYFVFNKANDSKKLSSLWKSILAGVIFITFVNLIMIIVNLLNGNNIYTIDQNLSFFPKAFQIIKLVLPFHGLFELGKYLVGLI